VTGFGSSSVEPDFVCSENRLQGWEAGSVNLGLWPIHGFSFSDVESSNSTTANVSFG
jgi:hypothetical protein